MAQSYTRQSTFADGDTITASLFNNEYDQLVNSFFYSSTNETITGHRHDGSVGQGGNIPQIGDLDFNNKIVVDATNNRWGVYVEVAGVATEQVRIQDGAIVPVTTNDIDLGTGSLQFKDLFIDGTASIDSLTLSTGSTVTVILDEDNLSTNSDTALATQQSIKAYVDSQVTAQDLDVTADSGTISIDLDSETINFLGGTGIDTFALGSDVYIAIDNTVATLADAQTLTNKTIDASSNTLSNIANASLTNSTVSYGGIQLSLGGTDATPAFDLVDATGYLGDSALVTTGALNSGSITAGFGSIDVGSSNISTLGTVSGGTLTGTLSTAAQANVTSLGALTSLTVTGDLTVDTSTLKVNSSTNRVGILNTSPDVTLDIGSATDAVHIPVGTTAQRPGSPASGYFRYNTSLAQFEGYTDTWGAIGGGGTNTFTHDSFTGDNTTVDFVLSQSTESENNLFVFIDGVFQTQDAYSISTAAGITTLTLSAAPATGRKIIVYTVAAGVSGNNLNSNQYTGDGVTTDFTLAIPPINENNTQVFISGVYQQKDAYTVSGTTLSFSNAPPLDSTIEVMIFTQTEVNVPVDGTIEPVHIKAGDFYFDTDTLYIDSVNNRVGIGTDSPNAPLTVQAATGASAINLIGRSSDGYSSLAFRNNANDTSLAAIYADDSSDSMQILVAGTEAMRIDANGNVGIGTDSPDNTLMVQGASTDGSASTGNVALFEGPSGTNGLKLFIDDAENAAGLQTIGNDDLLLNPHGGNVLVGKTATVNLGSDTTVGHTLYDIGVARHVASGSPSLQLTRTSSDGDIAVFTKDGATVGSIGVYSSDRLFIGAGDTNITFKPSDDILYPSTSTGFARDATISFGDSGARFKDLYLSGNTLAGTTSTNPYTSSTETGAVVRGDEGILGASRDGGPSLRVNRIGTGGTEDGDIAEFRSNGTTVGSIGIESGGFYIDGEAAHSGLSFGGNSVVARDNGTRVDNTVDLGSNVHRFKDLYLSGGAYLGGVAAANLLDDYEEGTWTPDFVGDSTAGSYSSISRSGTYTKVGRLVTATFYFYGTSGTGSGKLNITGFPFSVQGAAAVSALQYNGGLSLPSGTGVPFIFIVSSSTTAEIRCNSDTGGTFVEMDYPTTANFVRASVTYETS